MTLEGADLIPFGVLVTALVVWALRRRRWPAWRLAVAAAFCIYLTGVAMQTLFPIVVGVEPSRGSISLRSIVHLHAFEGMFTSAFTRQQSFLNVVLGVPFGLLVPLLGLRSPWKVLLLGLTFAVGIEGLQLLEDLFYRSQFRTVDINDVILNWLGVAIGLAVYLVAATSWSWLPGRARPQTP